MSCEYTGANTATGSASTVPGGLGNTAAGDFSTVPGGEHNDATGAYSFAAGRRATAAAQGCFAWADSVNADFTCNVVNGFFVRRRAGCAS